MSKNESSGHILSPDELQALRFETFINDFFTDNGKESPITSGSLSDKSFDSFFKGKKLILNDNVSMTEDRGIAKSMGEGGQSSFDKLTADYYGIGKDQHTGHIGVSGREIRNDLREYISSGDFKADIDNYMAHRDDIQGISLSDVGWSAESKSDIEQIGTDTARDGGNITNDLSNGSVPTEERDDDNNPSPGGSGVEVPHNDESDKPSIELDGNKYKLDVEKLSDPKGNHIGYHCSFEDKDGNTKEFVVGTNGLVTGSNVGGIEYGSKISSSVSNIEFNGTAQYPMLNTLSAFERGTRPDVSLIDSTYKSANNIIADESKIPGDVFAVQQAKDIKIEIERSPYLSTDSRGVHLQSIGVDYPRQGNGKIDFKSADFPGSVKGYFDAIVDRNVGVQELTERCHPIASEIAVALPDIEKARAQYYADEKKFDTQMKSPALSQGQVEAINAKLDRLEGRLSSYGDTAETQKIRTDISELRGKLSDQLAYQERGKEIAASGNHEAKVAWAGSAPLSREDIQGLQAYSKGYSDLDTGHGIEKSSFITNIQEKFSSVSNPDVEKARGTLDTVAKNIDIIQSAGISSPTLDSTKAVVEQKREEIKTTDNADAVSFADRIRPMSEATFNGLSIANPNSVRLVEIGAGDDKKAIVQPINERVDSKTWETRGYLVTIPGEQGSKSDHVIVGADNKVCASTTDKFQVGTELAVSSNRDHVTPPASGDVIDVYARVSDVSRGVKDVLRGDIGKTADIILDAKDRATPSAIDAASGLKAAAASYMETGKDSPDKFQAALSKAEAGEQVIAAGRNVSPMINDTDLKDIKSVLDAYDAKIKTEISQIPTSLVKDSTAVLSQIDRIDAMVGRTYTPEGAAGIRQELAEYGSKPMESIADDMTKQRDYISQGLSCETFEDKKAWLESTSPVDTDFSGRIEEVKSRIDNIADQYSISNDVAYFDKQGDFHTVERPARDASDSDLQKFFDARTSVINDTRAQSPTIGFKDGLDTTRISPTRNTTVDGQAFTDVKISRTDRTDPDNPVKKFIIMRTDQSGNVDFFGTDGKRFHSIEKDPATHSPATVYQAGTRGFSDIEGNATVRADEMLGKTTYSQENTEIVKSNFSRGISQAEKSCSQIEGSIQAYGNILQETEKKIDVMHSAGIIDDDKYRELKTEISERINTFENDIVQPFTEYKESVEHAKEIFASDKATPGEMVDAARQVTDKDKFQSIELRADIKAMCPLAGSDIESGAKFNDAGRPVTIEERVKTEYDANREKIDAYKDEASKEDRAKIVSIEKQEKLQEKYEAALKSWEGYADKNDFVRFSAKGFHQVELDWYSWKGQIPKPDGTISTAGDVTKSLSIMVHDIDSGRFIAAVIGEAVLGEPVTTTKDGKHVILDKEGNVKKELSPEEYSKRIDAFKDAQDRYKSFMSTLEMSDSKEKSPYSDAKMSVAQSESLGFNAWHKFELAYTSYRCGIAVDKAGNIIEGAAPSKEAVVSTFFQAIDTLNRHPVISLIEVIIDMLDQYIEKYDPDKVDKKDKDDDGPPPPPPSGGAVEVEDNTIDKNGEKKDGNGPPPPPPPGGGGGEDKDKKGKGDDDDPPPPPPPPPPPYYDDTKQDKPDKDGDDNNPPGGGGGAVAVPVDNNQEFSSITDVKPEDQSVSKETDMSDSDNITKSEKESADTESVDNEESTDSEYMPVEEDDVPVDDSEYVEVSEKEFNKIYGDNDFEKIVIEDEPLSAIQLFDDTSFEVETEKPDTGSEVETKEPDNTDKDGTENPDTDSEVATDKNETPEVDTEDKSKRSDVTENEQSEKTDVTTEEQDNKSEVRQNQPVDNETTDVIIETDQDQPTDITSAVEQDQSVDTNDTEKPETFAEEVSNETPDKQTEIDFADADKTEKSATTPETDSAQIEAKPEQVEAEPAQISTEESESPESGSDSDTVVAENFDKPEIEQSEDENVKSETEKIDSDDTESEIDNTKSDDTESEIDNTKSDNTESEIDNTKSDNTVSDATMEDQNNHEIEKGSQDENADSKVVTEEQDKTTNSEATTEEQQKQNDIQPELADDTKPEDTKESIESKNQKQDSVVAENVFIEEVDEDQNAGPDKHEEGQTDADKASSSKGENATTKGESESATTESKDGPTTDDKKEKDKDSKDSKENTDTTPKDDTSAISDMKEAIDGVLEHGSISGTDFQDRLKDTMDKISDPKALEEFKSEISKTLAAKYESLSEKADNPDSDTGRQIDLIAGVENEFNAAISEKQEQLEHSQESSVSTEPDDQKQSEPSQSLSEMVTGQMEADDTSDSIKEARLDSIAGNKEADEIVEEAKDGDFRGICDFINEMPQFVLDRIGDFLEAEINEFKDSVHDAIENPKAFGEAVIDYAKNSIENKADNALSNKAEVTKYDMYSRVCKMLGDKLHEAAGVSDGVQSSLLDNVGNVMDALADMNSTISNLYHDFSIQGIAEFIEEKFKPSDSPGDNIDISGAEAPDSAFEVPEETPQIESVENGSSVEGNGSSVEGDQIDKNDNATQDRPDIAKEQDGHDGQFEIKPPENEGAQDAVDAEGAKEAAAKEGAQEAAVDAGDAAAGIEAGGGEAAAAIIV